MSLNIELKTIPHSQHRYPTVGDWIVCPEQKKIVILVSETGDWKQEFLIALHELIECMLCQAEGIKQIDVDLFDIEYEQQRPPGDLTEPGDDPKAPYYKQHRFASFVERATALELKVNWEKYEEAIADLSND